MIEVITPNSGEEVNTVRCEDDAPLEGLDLKHLRIERLKKFAVSRNVLDNPAELGKLIGKKPNQVYNLLSGAASFGEKVARSIEDSAGLARYWLDTDEQAQVRRGGLDPEIAEVAAKINSLPKMQREWVLQVARQTLDLALQTLSHPPAGEEVEPTQPTDAEKSRKKRPRK